jgi:hypothetical protein
VAEREPIVRPWKPAAKRHNFAFVASVVRFAGFAGKFERGFVGLRAGVAEKDLVGEGVLHQLLRQLGLRRAVEQVADVGELGGLVGNGRYPIRIAVPQRRDGNARGKIEILTLPSLSYKYMPSPWLKTMSGRLYVCKT